MTEGVHLENLAANGGDNIKMVLQEIGWLHEVD